MFPSTKIHDLLAISVIALMTAIPSSMGAFSTVNIRVNNGLTSTWSFKKNHAALKRHLFEDNISRKSRTSSLLITKESSDIEVEEQRKDAKDNNNNIASTGVKLGLASFASTVVASLAIFLAVDEATIQAYQNDPTQPNAGYASVVANARSSSSSSNKGEEKNNIPPPPITATSSERTLAIASDLQSLDSKMYGAYWCSHCFEQKQRLGKEAMKSITYVECAKEGLNSQRDLCNAKDVPGYPTWEIGGKLYPGEYYLDELEEIIQNTKDRSK
mmetsp:Transcript_2237/g.3134  ORF Transcript_2237/g.3134 Transcript_2237/m.3134 type:complete len:272 (+) Transcript_2237:79-894(+)